MKENHEPVNEVLRQLQERKSVRAYERREISDADKNRILHAAAMAPTAGNQQLYTILDITEQGLKNRLAETCDHQPFIAKASMVLIFLADCQKWYDAFVSAGCQPRAPGLGDLMLAVTDATIAAQNAVVAAQSLGIGSCYIGDIMENREVHRELLQLPEYVFPAAMLVLGYPTEQQLARPKPRRADSRHIVHQNAYRQMDGGELREMLESRTEGKDYGEWIQAFCARKYNSDFSREMTRSVEGYCHSFAKR